MKNKLQITFATLTLAAGLLLTAVAQGPGQVALMAPKPDFGIKVPLLCKQAGSGDVKAKLIARNNTRQTVPQGTVIHFTTNGGVSGTYTLASALLSGRETTLGKEDVVPYTCQAHYIKY